MIRKVFSNTKSEHPEPSLVPPLGRSAGANGSGTIGSLCDLCAPTSVNSVLNPDLFSLPKPSQLQAQTLQEDPRRAPWRHPKAVAAANAESLRDIRAGPSQTSRREFRVRKQSTSRRAAN